MLWFQYLIISIYVLLLLAYFYTETLGRSKIRALNKMLLAALYLLLIFLNYFTKSSDKGIEYILLIALVMTFLGDGILLIHFSLGALFFTISNVILFIFNLLLFKLNDISFNKFYWLTFIMALIWIVFGVFTKNNKRLEYPSNKWALSMGYVFFVTLHGILGLGLIIYIKTIYAILIGVGEFLYMLSDYILVIYTFSKDKNIHILRLNSIFYFIGILLISISVFMF